MSMSICFLLTRPFGRISTGADMLSQWRLWYYATIGFLIQAVLAGCIFFVPLIIDSMFTGEMTA